MSRSGWLESLRIGDDVTLIRPPEADGQTGFMLPARIVLLTDTNKIVLRSDDNGDWVVWRNSGTFRLGRESWYIQPLDAPPGYPSPLAGLDVGPIWSAT